MQQDVVEQRRVRAGLAEQPEGERDRHLRHFRQQIGPAEVGQGRVEGAARRRRHRLAERLREQVPLDGIHPVSFVGSPGFSRGVKRSSRGAGQGAAIRR
ncbi:hypothetical protein ACGFZ9_31860 [Streptomyces mirabilis]|uniref:hypothetical protein n=1 Tax=Streptomyces mirabilis TaxID=68239 RepID=UPI003713F8B3